MTTTLDTVAIFLAFILVFTPLLYCITFPFSVLWLHQTFFLQPPATRAMNGVDGQASPTSHAAGGGHESEDFRKPDAEDNIRARPRPASSVITDDSPYHRHRPSRGFRAPSYQVYGVPDIGLFMDEDAHTGRRSEHDRNWARRYHGPWWQTTSNDMGGYAGI